LSSNAVETDFPKIVFAGFPTPGSMSQQQPSQSIGEVLRGNTKTMAEMLIGV
jgi:hypothetical protein